MKGLVVVGHGSLRSESGLAMMRVAATLRKRTGLKAEAGFLNFSRPSLAEALQRVVDQGADEIVVQPYFLVSGVYVQRDLPRAVENLAVHRPGLSIRIGGPFGESSAVEEILLTRLLDADPAGGSPQPRAGLLLLAHGSPEAEANAAVERVLARLADRTAYGWTGVGFLECARPEIGEAIDQAASAGVKRLVALPFFLHEGRHAREDLPGLLAQGAARWPKMAVRTCDYIGYDERIVDHYVSCDSLGIPAILRAQPAIHPYYPCNLKRP